MHRADSEPPLLSEPSFPSESRKAPVPSQAWGWPMPLLNRNQNDTTAGVTSPQTPATRKECTVGRTAREDFPGGSLRWPVSLWTHSKASACPPRVAHCSLSLATLAGSRKLKDNGLRTKRRQTFPGLSPERAVGKVSLEDCPGHRSGVSRGSPRRAATTSSLPVLEVHCCSKCLSDREGS